MRFESRKVGEIKKNLTELSRLSLTPNIFLDVKTGKYKGEIGSQRHLFVKAVEIAELTLQRRGSTYGRPEGISLEEVKRIVAYIGGINPDRDLLIIGNDVTQGEGNLNSPATLSLEDLIGYRTIDKLV